MVNSTKRQLLKQTLVAVTGLGIPGSEAAGGHVDSPQEKSLSGSEGRDWYSSVLSTADGGFLVSGGRATEMTTPFGETTLTPNGWVQKFTADGEVVWSETYASPGLEGGFVGPDIDHFLFTLPGADGGYLHVGRHYDDSSAANLTWLVKTDASGTEQWERYRIEADIDSFTNDFRDGITTDDGYVLVGRAIGAAAGDERRGDGWVVALSPDGAVRWDRLYNPRDERSEGYQDDPEHDEFYAITETHDGNYLLAGEARGTDASASAGWLVEITPDGDKQWERLHSVGDEDVQFTSVERVEDGYIAGATTGSTAQFGIPTSGNRGYVFKLDTNGEIQWREELGSGCSTVLETADRQVLAAGQRESRAFLGQVTGDGTGPESMLEVEYDESVFHDCVELSNGVACVGEVRGDATGFNDGLVAVGQFRESETNTLTVTKEGAPDERAMFFVVSSAGVTPTESAEGISTETAALDWVGPARGTDTYQVTGRPETFLLKGRATVRWNGEVVDPSALGTTASVDGASLSQTLRVESTGTGYGYYAVSTSDGIAETDRSEASTDGYNLVDFVGPSRGVDEFRFAGDITRFLASEHLKVSVNGEEIYPAEL